ncbi:MAG TPA: glycosyltransferase [Candidatus Paceibacterota bacterium]|nr:glycosyltransferase [Candidatus Paceibacterota bacterium]
MIKSAHLTASVSRKAGGLYDAVSRVARSQHRQGMDVKVFGLLDEFTGADLKAWNPAPVAAFKPSWPNLIGRSPQFLEALNAFAPDICHTHGLWLYPGIAANHYSRKNNRPYLISPHGMLDQWAMKNSRWKKQIAWRLFEREHLRGARCLRALCVPEANAIRQLQLKNDIAVIPNGIDLPEMENAESLKFENLKFEKQKVENGNPPWENFVEPGRKALLYLGRIHPKKGLANLLKAWVAKQKAESRKQKAEEWFLAVAGWDQGGHEAELKRICAELRVPFADIRDNPSSSIFHLPSPIIFLGPQFNEAKAACYRHCDAFVLPSFSEGLPMVVLEAWAYSKPVIMTPECNLPEGFQSGAALKAEATGTSLAAGLNELQRMTDAERMAMGSRGHDLVLERFTWPRVAQQLQSVQEWILGGGAKPGCLFDA